VNTKTTRNKYRGHGVGVYTENMLKWLPQVSRLVRVETQDWRNCDVYLQPSFYDGFPLRFVGLKVVMVHDLTLLKFNYFSSRGTLINFLRGLEYRFRLRCVKQADVILTNSENTRQDTIQLLKVPSYKVKAIPLGLKALDCSGGKKGEGQPKDPYLLYVGGVEFNKNLIRLIKAFYRIKQEQLSGLESLKLVMVGGGFWQKSRPETAKVIKEIQSLGLDEEVLFPGYIPDRDLGSWYAQARAFVYPSFYEGFGFPVLEAMSCGVPVAVSNVSSLPEVGGQAVAYFDPYQVEDMVLCLKRVLEDFALRERLAAAGRERAKQFTWSKTARRTYQVICSFLS